MENYWDEMDTAPDVQNIPGLTDQDYAQMLDCDPSNDNFTVLPEVCLVPPQQVKATTLESSVDSIVDTLERNLPIPSFVINALRANGTAGAQYLNNLGRNPGFRFTQLLNTSEIVLPRATTR